MSTPRGWYDVGGGMVGLWDGEKWSGERISHEQLAALTKPAAPPPPMMPPPPSFPAIGRPPTPPPRWMIYLGIVALVGFGALAIAGAVLNSEADQRTSVTTTRATLREEPLELTRARREAAEVCRLEESADWWIGVPVPDSGGPCKDAAVALGERFGFTAAEVDRVLTADGGERVERGDWAMVNFDDELVGSVIWFSTSDPP